MTSHTTNRVDRVKEVPTLFLLLFIFFRPPVSREDKRRTKMTRQKPLAAPVDPALYTTHASSSQRERGTMLSRKDMRRERRLVSFECVT